jgi:hypothetical protein
MGGELWGLEEGEGMRMWGKGLQLSFLLQLQITLEFGNQ